MILVDQTAVPLATPDVIGDLGGATSDGQWILTANILPLAALMVLGGRLGDLLGLRRVFIAGAAIFTLATVAAGAAQDKVMLIAARAVQGMGAALMMPVAVAGGLGGRPRRGQRQRDRARALLRDHVPGIGGHSAVRGAGLLHPGSP